MAGRGLGMWMLFLSSCVAGSSGIYAQNAYLWDGFYAGVNAGAGGGAAANCATFSGISFSDARDALRADLFRIGVFLLVQFLGLKHQIQGA